MSPSQENHDGFDDVELKCEDTAADDYGRNEGAQQQYQKQRGSIPPDPADFYETVSVAEDEDEYDFVDDPNIPKDPHYDPTAYIPPPHWEQRYHTTRLLIRDLPTHIHDLPTHITSLRRTVAELDTQQATDLAVRAARTGVAVGAVLVAGGVQVGAALVERTGPVLRDGVGALRARLVSARQGGRAETQRGARVMGEAREGTAARRRLLSPGSSPYAIISERVDELPTSDRYVECGKEDSRAGWTRAAAGRGEQSRFLNGEAGAEEEWVGGEMADEFDEEEELEYDRVVRTRGRQWIER